MNSPDLTSLSLTEAAAFIRDKKVSPVELTEACLRRIESLDGELNCFITVTAEQAMDQARRAEEDILRGAAAIGSPIDSMLGVPIAVKDNFKTKGARTTAGSKFIIDDSLEEDAEAVRRCRAAGAILIGKTNLHEIALGLTSVNPHYRPVRNPWQRGHAAGGSSGGSAAGLAARFFPTSLGTDTGGSIRVPAALCGVIGLKPTFGRLSKRGVIPLSWNLDHVGPMARRVYDLAILLQVLAGFDPLDPYSVDISVDNYFKGIDEGVHGWRIVLAEGEYFVKTQTKVEQLVQEAGNVFKDLGAHIFSAPIPDVYRAASANGMMTIADAAVFHSERLRDYPDYFGADVRQRLENGIMVSLADYIKARQTQSLIRREFEAFFQSYDLLLMPTVPISAPMIEGADAVEMARLLTRYTAPFNLTGLPAISLPCGFTDEGLPVGLQIIAPPWAEARLFRAAYAYEKHTEWYLCEPKL